MNKDDRPQVTDQQKPGSVSVITNEEFVKERPWICCRDPLFVGRDKDTQKPLVAQCDRMVGHAGKHRGRLDGATYWWRTRSPKETARLRAQQIRKVEAENRRANYKSPIGELSFDFGWLIRFWLWATAKRGPVIMLTIPTGVNVRPGMTLTVDGKSHVVVGPTLWERIIRRKLPATVFRARPIL